MAQWPKKKTASSLSSDENVFRTLDIQHILIVVSKYVTAVSYFYQFFIQFKCQAAQQILIVQTEWPHAKIITCMWEIWVV